MMTIACRSRADTSEKCDSKQKKQETKDVARKSAYEVKLQMEATIAENLQQISCSSVNGRKAVRKFRNG